MSFTIDRLHSEHWRPIDATRMPPPCTWCIRYGDVITGELCWDEMIEWIARSLIAGQQCGYRDTPRHTTVWSLSVIETATRLFTLRCADRFISELTAGEALAFISLYTSTDGQRQLFTGLQTYEQWTAVPWRKEEISGLLTAG